MADQSIVAVEGLRTLQKAFRQLGTEIPKELRLALKAAAEPVAAQARASIPRRSGRAAKSVKAGATATYAYVKGGGPSAPYFGWLEFGGTIRGHRYPSHRIVRTREPQGRYLNPAVDRLFEQTVERVAQAVDDACRKAGFTE